MRLNALGFVLFLITPLLVGGCVNTYMQQRADLSAGGPQMRQAAAQQRVNAAQQRSTDLNDQLVSAQRDVERSNRQLAAAQSGLAAVQRDLERARRQQRISQAEYSRVKAEADRLEQEVNNLDFQMKTVSLDNPAEIAAKQQQIQALEIRREELKNFILTGQNQ